MLLLQEQNIENIQTQDQLLEFTDSVIVYVYEKLDIANSIEPTFIYVDRFNLKWDFMCHSVPAGTCLIDFRLILQPDKIQTTFFRQMNENRIE